MEKFNRTLHGYNPKEVNDFLDQVIMQVEAMIKSSKEKDIVIDNLIIDKNKLEQEIGLLKNKASNYKEEEIFFEKELILKNAKKDADRIINDALVRAEKTNMQTDILRRNIKIFKRRLKMVVESQLEIIDDIDNIDL